jgi:Ca-activated chloride channel family protein
VTFADPARLWLLVAVVALLGAYVLLQRRRGTYALRFSDATLLDTVAPRRPRWRRHLVALTFLAATSSMVVAMAGPQREEDVPRERATVVLTIDTSLSMGSDDVDPSRIDAAKEAALSFLADAPETVDIGLVSFDAIPVVRVSPTKDRAAVEAAIEALELGEMTVTGDAIFASLEVLVDTTPPESTGDPDGDGQSPASVVVLLSDGEPTGGRTVAEASVAAVEAGVPVSTVAFGTPDGVVEIEDPENPGSTVVVPVPVDEPTLGFIADTTGGTFFAADSADELAQVYRDIGTAVGFETVERDISDWFTGIALVLALLTGGLSLLWFQRLP